MKHPPGLEVTLRKRICLRVYKKIGFGASIIRAFAGKVWHGHRARYGTGIGRGMARAGIGRGMARA